MPTLHPRTMTDRRAVSGGRTMTDARTTSARRLLAGAAGLALLAGCTSSSSSPAPSATAPSTAEPSGAGATTAVDSQTPWTPGPSDVDLPAPSPPSSPAPSTAGSLGLTSVPVPAGWRAASRKGSIEEGFLGNGTPAHARDPRYAAYEIMSVGCAEVRRGDWSDPSHALEVTLARGGATGVAEAMVFADAAQARTWFGLWTKQLEACAQGSSPRTTSTTATATSWVGRRSYGPGDSWAEVGAVNDNTVRLYLLGDPDGAVTTAQQDELLQQVTAAG